VKSRHLSIACSSVTRTDLVRPLLLHVLALKVGTHPVVSKDLQEEKELGSQKGAPCCSGAGLAPHSMLSLDAVALTRGTTPAPSHRTCPLPG
jgi:hypothetical protein